MLQLPDTDVAPVTDEAAHWRRGRHLAAKGSILTWELADWCVAGKPFDPAFRKSALISGYSASYLFTLYRTALAFPPDVREPTVSMSVHRELLREPNDDLRRDDLLRATSEQWTQQEAIEHMDARATPRVPTGHPSGYQHKKVECPKCHHQFSVKGNKVSTAVGGNEEWRALSDRDRLRED